MPFALTSPSAAIVLLGCLPIVWLAYRSYRRFSSRRKTATTAVRLFGFGLLALSLMGFRSQRPTQSLATVFVVDDSASISADERRRALDFVREAVRAVQPDDRYAVVAFGRQPLVATPWSTGGTLDNIRVETDGSATNIAEALNVAAAILPDRRVGRIVLLSDGEQTNGDAHTLPGVLRLQDATVDAVPLAGGGGVDSAVTAVSVPDVVEPGSPVSVRIEFWSNGVANAVLRVYRNGAIWHDEPITLPRGRTSRVFQDQAPAEAGVQYRVELDAAGDARPENNAGLAAMRVAAPPQVWIVDGDDTAGDLVALLQAQHVEAARVGPNELPDAPAGYANIRSVVLNNVPAAALTLQQQDALATAVRDFGVGMVMTGGEHSFGPGGWRHTPVEDVLPVTMESTRPRQGTVGIVLCMDVSGSMNAEVEGRPRLRFAQEAGLAAYRVAEKETLIGVVAFSNTSGIILPLERRPGNLNGVLAQFERVRADGGTIVTPALRLAIEMLTASAATTRHIILLTDGEFHDPESVRALYPALNAAHVSVSTVGAGPDVVESQLKEVAQECNGKFYPYRRAGALPAIVASDTVEIQREPIIPGPVLPVGLASGDASRGVDWTAAPPLDGMVSTTLRDGARLLASSPDRDPLVASWRVGLARTAVLCTDLGDRFAAPWLAWPGRRALWESLVRATLAPTESGLFSADVRLDGDEAVITADAVDAAGAFVNGLRLEATVQGGGGEARVVALHQEGPGRYVGRVPVSGFGTYSVQVRGDPDQGAGRAWASVARAYPAEFLPVSEPSDLLYVLAEQTGGDVLTEPSQAFRRPPEPRTVQSDLWPWLTGVALVLFPVDVALRRFSGRGMAPATLPHGEAAAAAPERDATRTRRARPRPAPEPSAAGADREPVEPSPTPVPEEPGPGERTTARLLAAKRRAQSERDDA